MFRAFLIALSLLTLAGCAGGGPPTEAEALDAVRVHLAKRTDLNFGEMGLVVESVKGDSEQAEVSIGFQLAGQTESAMSMQYQLRHAESGWAVEAPAAGGGAGHGSGQQVAPPPSGGGDLPPNHPPLGTEPQQDLPPNHPPVAQ